MSKKCISPDPSQTLSCWHCTSISRVRIRRLISGQGTSVLLAFCLHFMPREIGMIKAIDDGPYSAYPATKLNRFPIFIHRPGMFFYSWANPPYRIDLISPTFFINIDLISSDL